MIPAPVSWLASALIERWVLLLNHVVGAESAATSRLQVHAGRVIRLQFPAAPRPLPSLPDVTLRITPAGLFETAGDVTPPADVTVRPRRGAPFAPVVDALRGQRPTFDYDGDPALAADLAWLVEHLRWDVGDDLARFVGPGPSEHIVRTLTALGRGLRDAVERATGRRPTDRPPGE